MATKPTLVSYTQTTRNSTASPKTSGAITVAVGDFVVVVAVGEGESLIFGTPTSSGITFSAGPAHDLTNYTEVGSWYGTVTSGTSINVSISNSGSAIQWGFEVWVWRGSDGLGATNKANATTGGPSVSLTTTGANSAVICAGGDWNAAATTGKTWRTVNSITPTSGNGLEKVAAQQGSAYTVYSAYWDDVGATGAKTFGMSAPSQKYAYVAIEVKGTASAATTADAELASATAVAYAPTVEPVVVPDAGLASVVAAAYDPTIVTVVATTADAGLASASAAAYDPTVTAVVAPDAGLASATGAAYRPDIPAEYIDASPGEGGAVGAAYAPTIALAAMPPAEVASVVAAAYSPTIVTVESEPVDPDLNIPVPLRVEWLLGGTWMDLTDRTYTRQSVEIERGIPDEGTRADPTKVSYQVNNRDGQLSLRNPLSPYYSSLGRNIPSRIVIDVASDNFDRTVTGGWGRSSSRYDWTVGGNGQTAQYTTASDGYGRIAVSTENSEYTISLGIDVADLEFAFTFRPGVVATGAAYTVDAQLRAGSGEYYAGRLTMGTDGMVDLSIIQEGISTFVSATDMLAYGSGTELGVRFKINGRTMALKVWDISDGEPRDWTIHAADATASAKLSSGAANIRVIVPTASTLTLPRTFMFGNVDLVHYRAAVEVTSPPTRWDVSGQDVWVAVQAAGIARRLGQAELLASALTRAHAGLANYSADTGMPPLVPLDHWPMEGDAPGGVWGNVVPGGSGMYIAGSGIVATGEAPVLDGSGPLAKFDSTAYTSARIRNYADIGVWSTVVVTYIDPALSNRANPLVLDVRTGDPKTTLNRVLVYIDMDNTRIDFAERVGSTVTITNTQAMTAADVAHLRGNWAYVALAIDNANNVKVFVYWDYLGQQEGYFLFGTLANTYGPATALYHGGASDGTEHSYGQAAFYVGDATLYTSTIFDRRALWGFVGEPAAERVQRLCREQQVAIMTVANDEDSTPMGAQKPGKFLDLLDECVLTDMGLLFEARDELAFVYLSRRVRYNIDPTLELTYSARGHVSPPIEPLPDDFAVTNDLTVQRVDGASARYTLTEGTMSTQPPPDGIGSYSQQRQVSLGGDDLAAGRASWEVFVSTYDEERYPTIHVDMIAAIAAEEGDLVAAAKRLDSGDRITISDMPAWQPPGGVDQIALGFRETLGDGGQGGYAWDIEMQCRPYGVWGQVGVMQTLAATPAADEVGTRMDTAGSRTSGLIVSGFNTSLTVVTYQGPIWGVTGDARMDFPFDIRVAGVVLRVTGISGSSSPQTFTISTTLPQGSGYVKTIPSGSEVKLAYPARFGL